MGHSCRAPRRTAYFAGDTNVFLDMNLIRELYHPDLAFLPIGDLFTMSPHEAAMACHLLQAPKVVRQKNLWVSSGSGNFPSE